MSTRLVRTFSLIGFPFAFAAAQRAQAEAAEPPPPPPPSAPAEPPSPEPSAEQPTEDGAPVKKKKKKKSLVDSTELGLGDDEGRGLLIDARGRVFAGAYYDDDVIETDAMGTQANHGGLTLAVPSARAGVKVQVIDFASLVLEADFAGKPKMKDGYVQAKKKHWFARVGQFKMPISSFTLESPWTLPLARRGMLEDVISDRMLLTGRRQGVMGQIKAGGWLDPALTLGAFQPISWDDGDPIPTTSVPNHTFVARASVTPGGVEAAAVFQRRVTAVHTLIPGLRSFWAAGVDATADFELERIGVRLWGEALTGSSWLLHESVLDPENTKTATFVEGRLLGAVRWGGLSKGAPYIEPFATAGALDPDTSISADLLYEIMGGVNVGHWKMTRLTLQFELDQIRRNFPRRFFGDFALPIINYHSAVVLQAGAAF
jgi:hypothetical protein